MSGQFSGNAQPQGIKASGEIILAGLVVDASLNPTVNRIRTTLQNQQVTSGLSATIGGLAPKLNAQEFFGARGQEAEYYHRVLQEVSRPNGLGTLKIPVGMENGYLYIAHFQNEFVAGDLQVELAPGRQGGKIEYLRLGAVELKDVQLGGTLEVPDNRFSLANLKLNGVPPPPGLRDLGTLSSSSDPASILRKDMENRVKNVVQKEIEKRMRDQAGKVLGDGLGGLLGGGSTGGESLPADPASAGQTILDALRVAPAAQPQPAPSAGAAPPAKPDVKEIGKELGEKLLRGLFK